jgi:hypothetical protein
MNEIPNENVPGKIVIKKEDKLCPMRKGAVDIFPSCVKEKCEWWVVMHKDEDGGMCAVRAIPIWMPE